MLSLLFALLQAHAVSAPATAAAPNNGWELVDRTQPDGSRRVVAGAHNEAGATLLVKCDIGKESFLSVQFFPKPPLAAGALRDVQMTFDEARAEFSAWEFPGSGAFTADPVEVFAYASGMAGAKSFSIALQEDNKAVGGEFKGPGDDSLFRKVFEACGRPYTMSGAAPAVKK